MAKDPNDGYTKKAYINGVPGLYGAAELIYRPFTSHELSAMVTQANGTTLFVRTNEEVAKRVISWTVRQRGQDVPLTADGLASLNNQLYQQVVSIVEGLASGDVNPTWTPEEIKQWEHDGIWLAPGQGAERSLKN